MSLNLKSSFGFLSSAAAAEIARKVLPLISVNELRENARRVKPLITAADSDHVRALKLRCVVAMHQASQAYTKGPIVNHQCSELAASIDCLSAMRGYQELGEPAWGRRMREILIKHQAASLGPALVEAAEHGKLADIARLLDLRRRDRGIIWRHLQLINAYENVLHREKRSPFIGELLRQLRINKPGRTSGNVKEWFKVNSRERVIRKVLKQYNLPLSPGKRGRPR